MRTGNVTADTVGVSLLDGLKFDGDTTVLLTNYGSVTVYVGQNGVVTADTHATTGGYELPANGEVAITPMPGDVIGLKTASSTARVNYLAVGPGM